VQNSIKRRTHEHRFSLELGNKCVKCGQIFVEETSIKMALNKTKYAGQEINDY